MPTKDLTLSSVRVRARSVPLLRASTRRAGRYLYMCLEPVPVPVGRCYANRRDLNNVHRTYTLQRTSLHAHAHVHVRVHVYVLLHYSESVRFLPSSGNNLLSASDHGRCARVRFTAFGLANEFLLLVAIVACRPAPYRGVHVLRDIRFSN